MSAILACTLYTDTIDDSTCKGVLGGVGMSKMHRNTDLSAILLKEQEERLPSDVALSVCTMPSGDPSGKQITTARTNPLT